MKKRHFLVLAISLCAVIFEYTHKKETEPKQVSVNEYNVFKYIILPEECSEISKDSLHPDRLQAYQHGDTLELKLQYYKN